MLVQDFHLLEKLAHQNRERISERVVHAKGSTAYGTMTVPGPTAQLGISGLPGDARGTRLRDESGGRWSGAIDDVVFRLLV